MPPDDRASTRAAAWVRLVRHTLGRWLEARQFAGEFDTQRRAEEVPVAEYVALAQNCS